MKKTAIAAFVALTMGGTAVSAATMTSATFTMLDNGGNTVGVDPTVIGNIGGGTWAVSSTTPFFGQNWTAHGGTTFGPGTYSFATTEGPTYTGVVVGTGQVGGHILFDWGPSSNIDVINVWDVSSSGGILTYTSSDATVGGPANAVGPDGVRGVDMIDGPFVGFNANFDFTVPASSPVPVPAAVWLFGSGLVGLVGVARRRSSKTAAA